MERNLESLLHEIYSIADKTEKELSADCSVDNHEIPRSIANMQNIKRRLKDFIIVDK